MKNMITELEQFHAQTFQEESVVVVKKKIITTLTPEQEQLMVDTRNKWIAIGRSTERLDREKASNAILDLYKEFNYKQPEIKFFDSPQSCLTAIVSQEKKHDYTMKEIQADPELSKISKEALSNYFSGGMWCAWKVFYDYCRKIGVEYTDKNNKNLDLWMAEAEHCSWWFPYEEIVFVSERPTEIHFDSEGRLHNENGPAMAYADGFKVFSIHGESKTEADLNS